MKLTAKQQLDLDTIRYYIPEHYEHSPITDEDIKRYFDWSDKGKGGDDIKREALQTNSGIAALYWGKNRRDLQVTSYIEDWGTYITSTDLASEEPEYICRWLAKVMNKPVIYTMWQAFNDSDTGVL